MSSPGLSPAEQRRLRFQVVTTPLVAATGMVVVGLLLLWLGAEAPLPWWPFVLASLGMVAFALLVGRRLVAQGTDRA